ncbi:MAG TPA: hypothetical protein VNL15_07300 [Dehalococcoidia bacterium]|nr:hypothetical protein [Dehalococcoidia bacterium]
MRHLRWLTVALFFISLLVFVSGQSWHNTVGTAFFQGPEEKQGPPPFDDTENDFRRLRIGPYSVKIDTGISGGLSVCVNHTNEPAGLGSSAVETAVLNALNAWDNEVTAELFAGSVSSCTETPPSSVTVEQQGSCSPPAPSFVRWASLGPNTVGQANFLHFCIDASTRVAKVRRFMITLNTDFAWAIGAQLGKYDVQSVVTHEAGHPVGLDDLNALKDFFLTMYRAASTNNTDRQTLGCGDQLGVKAIYPAPNNPSASACP